LAPRLIVKEPAIGQRSTAMLRVKGTVEGLAKTLSGKTCDKKTLSEKIWGYPWRAA
jgi:hypothetical protein